MKVKDLIVELGKMNPEAEVHFAYNYGDHWRTTVAPEVRAVSEELVTHSSYHDTDKVIRNHEDDFDAEKAREAVILRS